MICGIRRPFCPSCFSARIPLVPGCLSLNVACINFSPFAMLIVTENQHSGGTDKNLDYFHGIRPRLLLYSIGLPPPRDILMRVSLY